MKYLKIKLLLFAIGIVSTAAGEFVWQLTTDKKEAIYQKGEKITFTQNELKCHRNVYLRIRWHFDVILYIIYIGPLSQSMVL